MWRCSVKLRAIETSNFVVLYPFVFRTSYDVADTASMSQSVVFIVLITKVNQKPLFFIRIYLIRLKFAKF